MQLCVGYISAFQHWIVKKVSIPHNIPIIMGDVEKNNEDTMHRSYDIKSGHLYSNTSFKLAYSLQAFKLNFYSKDLIIIVIEGV